jgi:hypothetical protein
MKGLNIKIKAFFINHGEKLGFAVIVLAVLLIWTREYLGGAWALETRNPTQLVDEIKSKRTQIDNGRWPEEKKQEFARVDFSERAATLLRPIDTRQYELSTELFFPLNRPKEKAREPVLLAVESLLATPGSAILEVKLRDDEDAGNVDAPLADVGDAEADQETDPRFARRDSRGGNRAGGNVGGLQGGGGNAGVARDPAGGGGTLDMPVGGIGGPNAGIGGAGGAVSDRQAQGRFFVAVRGVWPINQQLQQIQRALHLPTTTAAMERLSLLDFELERQTATSGDDPWSKEWETLDIKFAQQVLNEVSGFDDEPLEMQVFDAVITMPLPMRMFGVWQDHATHPRVKNYEATPEQREREKEIQARLAEEYEKVKQDLARQQRPAPRGFAGQSNDFREMGNSMMRSGAMGDSFRQMANEMQGAQAGGRGALTPDKLSAEITAVGNLLLFRYFDFDVQPGYAYRYRVKLKLLNPNYERDAAEVEDPSVAEGESRTTPESNISNVAVMPSSPQYFLKDVEHHPLVDEGRRSRDVASVTIYEWHKKLGTQVYATIPVDSLGRFLGGKTNTDVLDVAAPVIEERDYDFTTEDLLLDVSAAASLVPENHPDLILPEKGRGAKTVPVGVAPEALVVCSDGDLKVLAAGQSAQQERDLQTYARLEREPFKDAVPEADNAANPLDFSPLGAAADDKGKSGKKSAKNKANPRKKSGGAAGGGVMPGGGGGGVMPGGGGIGGGGGVMPGGGIGGAGAKGKSKRY